MVQKTPEMSSAVKEVTDVYPEQARLQFMKIRRLVLESADNLQVGPLQEELRWGEPAYLTTETKAGTTLRIAWKPKNPDRVGIYVNCQTSLVEEFRQQYHDSFYFEGNRGLLVDCNKALPEEALGGVIAATLTYHRRKKSA